MAYKSSFSSRGFKSGLLNPYGVEVFICVLVSIFLIISYNRSNFFVDFKHYVISFSKPGLTLIAKPFEFGNEVLLFFSDFKEIKNQKILLEKKILNY